MMRFAVILAALLSSVPGPARDAAEEDLPHKRKILERCGAAEQHLAQQADRTWAAEEGASREHAALRAALNEPMPAASSSVLVYAAGGHLATEQFSIVLAKQDDGGWSATAVGRSQIWLPEAPWQPLPRREWTLTPDKGQRLDRILGDECFYAEPTSFDLSGDGPPGLGTMTDHLDVKTPSRRRSAIFLGGTAKGLTAEVVEIATPD